MNSDMRPISPGLGLRRAQGRRPLQWGAGGDISRREAKLVARARGRSGRSETIGQDSLGRSEGGMIEVLRPDPSLLAALDARVHQPK